MEVISITRIAAAARAAVQAGKTAEAGCPWPSESEAWPVFRLFFTTYREHAAAAPRRSTPATKDPA